MGKDPPKYETILDHMGKESGFLPCSAPFPSFPPPQKKMQCYLSPQILFHLYVWKDSFPLSKWKTPQILYSTNSIYIFSFHFIFILRYHCFEFPFLFLFLFVCFLFLVVVFCFVLFFFKTWNSSPKLKNYSPAFGANNRRIDAPGSLVTYQIYSDPAPFSTHSHPLAPCFMLLSPSNPLWTIYNQFLKIFHRMTPFYDKIFNFCCTLCVQICILHGWKIHQNLSPPPHQSLLKRLAMIFAGQENTFIIFRSKEIHIYFKTNI